MNSLTRRRFLVASGVVGAGALGYGATTVDWTTLFDRARSEPLAAGAGVLVVVTLYGGNDGLNTVVPAADRAYQDARADLAYKPEEVLDLGDGLGLNPGMKSLKSLWDNKKLAVVRGVGYPRPDRSHFRSMAIWQTASPETASRTGWLGRWLDAIGDDPVRAVSVEGTLPPLLAGEKTAGACVPVSGLQLPTGALGTAFHALGTPDDGDGTDLARAAKSIKDLDEVAKLVGSNTGKGKSTLASQLDLVAGLVEAGVPTRAYSVSLGGFDTHADERATQQRLLTELDGALGPFVDRMRGTDRGRNVVVLVYSEFGRRVRANASDGTDHGTAGPAFLLGDKVNGGFYGEQPSLTDLDDGDLKESTDFRDVYATLLEQVLGTDAGQVLPDYRGRLAGVLS